MHARDIMTRQVVTVHPSASVTQAANLLTEKGFSALPVVEENGELAGIVTEADVIDNRFPPPGSADGAAPVTAHRGRTVAEVMITPVVGVSQDADISVVVREMQVHRRRCVPIIDGSRLVGVITRRDVVRVLARSDEDIARDVRTHLKYLGGEKRWAVKVIDGEVNLVDEFESASDRLVAVALAEAVPGAVQVTVSAHRPVVPLSGEALLSP